MDGLRKAKDKAPFLKDLLDSFMNDNRSINKFARILFREFPELRNIIPTVIPRLSTTKHWETEIIKPFIDNYHN